jgi:hypothetical protein
VISLTSLKLKPLLCERGCPEKEMNSHGLRENVYKRQNNEHRYPKSTENSSSSTTTHLKMSKRSQQTSGQPIESGPHMDYAWNKCLFWEKMLRVGAGGQRPR